MKYVIFFDSMMSLRCERPGMPPKRRHSASATPLSGNDDHRIVSFRPRCAKINETTRLRGPTCHRDPDISLTLSLIKFELDGREDDYQHRMIMNGLAFVVLLALVTIGIWLAANINDRHHTLRLNVGTVVESGQALGNSG
jgi:hypothetical protein